MICLADPKFGKSRELHAKLGLLPPDYQVLRKGIRMVGKVNSIVPIVVMGSRALDALEAGEIKGRIANYEKNSDRIDGLRKAAQLTISYVESRQIQYRKELVTTLGQVAVVGRKSDSLLKTFCSLESAISAKRNFEVQVIWGLFFLGFASRERSIYRKFAEALVGLQETTDNDRIAPSAKNEPLHGMQN